MADKVLKIDVVIDTNDAETKLRGVDVGIRSLGSSLAELGKIAGAIGVGTFIAGQFDKAVDAMQAMAREAIKGANALQDMHGKTGLSLKTLQEMSFVAKQTGTDVNAFANAALMLGVNIEKAIKPTSNVRTALKDLGLSWEELRAMSPDQQFNAVVDALGRMEDPQRRNTDAMVLFGKQAKAILPAISEGYRQLADDAGVAGDDQIKAIDDLSDAWDRFYARRIADTQNFLGMMALAFQGVQGQSWWQTAKTLIGAQALGGPAGALGLAAGGLAAPALGKNAADAAQKWWDKQWELDQISNQEGAWKQAPDKPDKKAAAAAQRAAMKAERELAKEQKDYEDLTGITAVKAADDWLQKMEDLERRGIRPSEKALKDFNKAMEDGVDAMARGIPVTAALSQQMMMAWVRGLQPLVKGGLSQADIGALNKGGTNVGLPFSPAMIPNLGVTNGLGGLNLPGGFDPTAGAAANKVGLFGQLLSGFGGGKDFATQLSQTVLGALTGGGDVGKSVGGLLAGDLFKGIGQKLTASLGDKGLGGLIGSALGSIVPGLGTMLGGLAGGLLGKLFHRGPTSFEKWERERQSGMAEVQQRVAGNQDQMRMNWAMTGMGNDFDSVMKNNDPKFISKLLDELQGKTDRLTNAMQKYGISWQELGDKAKQAHVDMDAKELIADFDALSQAGMGTDSIIQHMGGSINEFVHSAMATGTAVPAAMKPMLDKMLQMGLLTDAAGNQLSDLSAITFSDALPKALDSIAQAIDRLASALGVASGAAGSASASAAGGGAPAPGMGQGQASQGNPDWVPPESGYNAPSDIGRDIPRWGDGSDDYRFHDGGYVGIPRFHRGGLMHDERLAILQTGEYVMSRNQVAQAKRGGGGMSTIIVQLDGRNLTKGIVRHLPGEVSKVIPRSAH